MIYLKKAIKKEGLKKMLELKLRRTTRNGKPSNMYYIILKDPNFRKDWTPGINQFIIDQTVRNMCNCKQYIEDLLVMPEFILDGEDVTSTILPRFVEELEKIFGEMYWENRRGKQQEGSKDYLEKNNVIVWD